MQQQLPAAIKLNSMSFRYYNKLYNYWTLYVRSSCCSEYNILRKLTWWTLLCFHKYMLYTSMYTILHYNCNWILFCFWCCYCLFFSCIVAKYMLSCALPSEHLAFLFWEYNWCIKGLHQCFSLLEIYREYIEITLVFLGRWCFWVDGVICRCTCSLVLMQMQYGVNLVEYFWC